jgi:hypothetical protein
VHLCIGKTRWFACSGILIEYDLYTGVLTSASLVRSSGEEDTIVDNLQVDLSSILYYCCMFVFTD